MFGSIGGGEILMILVLALLLFGPRRLPQIGKTLGRTLSEFRRATNDLKHNLEHEVALEDLESLKSARDGLQSAGREIADAVNQSNPLGIPRAAREAPIRGAETDRKAPSAQKSPDAVSQTEGPDGEAVDRA